MNGNTHFDLKLIYDGETVRAVGHVTPFIPATGPSMSHAGGDPAEGGEIEDFVLYGMDGIEIEDPDGMILSFLQDDIFEAIEAEKEM